MKIVITGGGSGGHIIPLLAVAHELNQRSGDTKIIYVGQRGDALADVPANDPSVDDVYSVSAGKLRRYADEGWKQLFDVRTQVLNIRDLFRIVAGVVQSYRLLNRIRPDVVFTRGGFVSVPVALAARLNHIPYITHDSDSTPSLANRLIARWAAMHAVALPPEVYPYPATKTQMVGIPVNANYQPVTSDSQQAYKRQLGLAMYDEIVLLTGGGNGARMLNMALVANARYMLAAHPHMAIVHLTGRALEEETNVAYDELGLGAARSRVHVFGVVQNLYAFSAAADVVIARGGATNLAEFAIQGKACLLVPYKQLGWNIKNAATLVERDAVVQLTEDQAEQPERLGRTVSALLADLGRRTELANNLAEFARPNAAAEIADILVGLAEESNDRP